ncbi:hypothetical protein [Aliiglaciecola litoralis]|uniref:Uncharacterized protein n=1 Tax=Aliiglaciecola litoralis TaxID=582857 RepID=A0ABN1LI27_9ALTE
MIRDIGAALALPIIGGFCFFVLPILVSKARLAVLQTAVSTNSSHKVATRFADSIAALPKRYFLPSVAAACVIVSCYFYTEGLFYVEELGFEKNLIRFPLALQGLYMWTSIVMSISVIFKITSLVADFVELDLKVDLFSADELFPIANTVFWNILVLAFGLSMAPLFWLGGEPVMIDFVIAMVLFLIMANLMFSPLLRVRQIILTKKAEALEAYRQSKLPSERTSIKPTIRENQSGLEVLAKMRSANIKQEIIRAREWPVNLHLAIRFVFLSLLPATSWAGASVLNWLLQ